ncbi:glycosyltransferase family 2 protein [Microbacterium sp. CH12i]|uniref:glycosyltransferase family 2 protein n=1 Tax=Microbacterium sp. CH12i TaxID=1479651 RepID=UPI001268A11F|nr:glycosyltransferase family 2 protein [Microbacterium sp. CH12i]
MTRLRTARYPVRPQSSNPTVSVVIPCFNYARFLPQSVGSALDQEGVEVNVIIVDDASPDESGDVARRLAAADERIAVFVNEVNRGAVATFNRGLAEAHGEFVVRLDADDLLTPGSLARAIAVMQAFPDVGLVYGHPLHFDNEDLPPARTSATGWLIWKGQDWLASRCQQGSNVITSPEVVMRRSVVDVVGGQRDLAHTHDMEMWLRISAHADVAYVLGADQAWHRDHAGSLSMKAADPLVILGEIRDAFDVLFEGESESIADAQRLHKSARRAVAEDALVYAQRRLDKGLVDERVHGLREFAVECSPDVRSSPLWTRQQRQIEHPSGGSVQRLRGLPRRLLRRRDDVARRRRWHCTGVYERLELGREGR